MTTLQDFRKKYPQYDDMQDDVLVERLHQKHYSDMPKPEYYARMGMISDPAGSVGREPPALTMGAQAAEPSDTQTGPELDIPQQNFPRLETADLNSVPSGKGVGERLTDAMTDVARSWTDMLRAPAQGTSVVVRDIKGNFLRPYLGEYHENPTASGPVPMAFNEHGGVEIDPEKHVVLYDPLTKKDQVFLRTEETNAGLAERLGHMFGAGAVTEAVTRIPHGVVTARGGGAKMAAKMAEKTAERAAKGARKRELLDDFTRMGVQPSQPVISQGKASGTVAQTLSRVPGAADVVVRNVRKAYEDTVAAVNRVASGYGVAGTRDRAGRVIQGGIDRAGKVIEGAQNAASIPSRFTTFRTKADALYARAGELIGEATTVSMTRTRQALETALNRTGVESVDELLRNPELRGLAEALKDAAELPFEAARQLRSKVGALTRSGGEEVLRTLDKAEVDRLYGAMTEDLMSAAQKAGGQRAAHALKRADEFYAAGNKRINESLQKLFKADSPELAYERLLTMLSEKTAANMKAVFALKRTLRSEEWGDVVATVIERMGKPTAGAASNFPGDEAFSIATFVTNFNRLSGKGREALFGGPLRKEMEALARVVSAQKNFEKLANVSASGSHALAGGGAIYFFQAPLTVLSAIGAGRTTASLLMSPRFVRWLNHAEKVKTPRGQVALMAQLQKIVQQEPHLSIPLQKVLALPEEGSGDATPPGTRK